MNNIRTAGNLYSQKYKEKTCCYTRNMNLQTHINPHKPSVLLCGTYANSADPDQTRLIGVCTVCLQTVLLKLNENEKYHQKKTLNGNGLVRNYIRLKRVKSVRSLYCQQ